MHTVQDALATIAKIVQPIPPANLALDDARGRFLAQDVHMDQDSPPFDRAQVDGFAVIAAHAPAGARLEVIGRVDAGGTPFTAAPGPSQCVAINTGAVVPAWADAVIMVEHTQSQTRDGTPYITLSRAAATHYG